MFKEKKSVSEILKDVKKDLKEMHREESWNVMHNSFKEIIRSKDIKAKDIDYLALNLGMFLASWGMYRGKVPLFQNYNYKIHIDVIKVLLKDKYKKLINLVSFNDFNIENIKLIEELYKDIKDTYKKHYENAGYKYDPTKTLITKVILGTYACTVAYDSYVSGQLRKMIKSNELEKFSLVINENNIGKSIEKIRDFFKDDQNLIRDELDNTPIMKLIDFYLWYLWDKENKQHSL